MIAYLFDLVAWVIIGCTVVHMFTYLYVLVAWIIIGYTVVHSVNPRKTKRQKERYECPADHYASQMGTSMAANATIRRGNQKRATRSHETIYCR